MSDVTMMDYIRETPERVLNIVNNSKEFTKPIVDFFFENQYDDIVIVASGSSYNGALCARTFMRKYLQTEVKLVSPFTFINYEHQYCGNSMMIFISQSGCSTNTINAVLKAKEKGLKTVALVGRDDCDLKQIADVTLNWQVGEEKIGFVTKGVVTLAAYLMVFSLEISLRKGIIDAHTLLQQKEDMSLAMQIHPQMVDETIKKFEMNFKDFTAKNTTYILGTGPSFGVATEAALKISETNGITALAVETEEYLHGPMYPTTPNTLVLLIDNNGNPSTERTIEIALGNKMITDKIFVITNDSRIEDSHAFRTEGQTSCHVSVLYKLACIETLAYLMTEATNKYNLHPTMKRFKASNVVASKSRTNLYLDLTKTNH